MTTLRVWSELLSCRDANSEEGLDFLEAIEEAAPRIPPFSWRAESVMGTIDLATHAIRWRRGRPQ